ncbi:hypothetical protein [Acinetobacter phage vB_ApiM_IME-Ap7]
MKVKITMNQERLDMWNVPNLKTGDILTVEPSDDGFAYMIVDLDFNPDFWLAIPKSFAEVVK